MYTISEWLTELWRWKQRTRTTLLKSYTRRKRREESSKNLSWDVEREGNPQKNLTWDKEHEQALQSVSRNPGCFVSWESSKNETNVTVSGLYKPLISNRSGFLPRSWDWSTHPPRPRRVDGKQARSVTDSGFKELLQAVARLWLPTVLLPTYWSEIQASCNLLIYFLQLIDLFLSSCNLLVSGSSDRVAARLLCQIPCNGGSPRTQTGICWKRFPSISISDFPHCRSRDGFPDSRLGRISRFPDLISGISRPWPLEHSRGGGVWPAAQQPRWPRPAFHCKEHQTSPSCTVYLVSSYILVYHLPDQTYYCKY